ncbi:MAG: lamin tail domain-containing protein [Candidatus Cloacimonetes bacterium]|nr:lamin tail domain-containing protein [Candidatus Cloacimonadota bacterium]
MLAAGDVWVIANSGHTIFPVSVVDELDSYGTDNTCAFNGDDARALEKYDSGVWTQIDVFGDPDNDPGNYWPVGSSTQGTKDRTLIRKAAVTQGNIVVLGSFGTDDPSSEWDVYSQDTYSDLGQHSMGADNTAPTVYSVKVLSGTEMEVTFDESVEQTTAETFGNYVVNSRFSILGAVQDTGNPAVVVLTADAITDGNWTLTVQNVEDLAGNPIVSDDEDFSYTYYPVVITEIDYNPAGDDAIYEFLEIYNAGVSGIALDNFTFAGITHTFAVATNIAAGEYVVVAVDAASYSGNGYQVVQWTTGSLSNVGEELELLDPDGNRVDVVVYSPTWGADGNGPTLELIDPAFDNALQASWQESYVAGGSPGAAVSTPPLNVEITDVTVVDATTIEVTYNQAVSETTSEEITNYAITTRVDITDATRGTIGGGWTNTNAVTLTVANLTDGNYTLTASNIEPDGGGTPSTDSEDFSYTAPAPTPNIVINEIYYNAPYSQGDDIYWEFLELYNAEVTAVDLSGFNFTQGFDYVFPAGISIASGEYLVIAVDSTNYEGNGYQVYEWTLGGLSNGGEDIELRDASASVVDYVNYDDAGNWPTSPDGGGPSLELIDPAMDNDDYNNWQASYVNHGTPGATNSSAPTQPEIASINVLSETSIEVFFNVQVDQTTAEETWRYTINARVSVDNAVRDATNHMLVILTVSGMTPGNYTLDAIGIQPESGGTGSDDSENFTVAATPDIIITEIMYNPSTALGADGDYEYLELYNAEGNQVDISGFVFTSGFVYTFPTGTTIEPDEYIIIAILASSYTGNGYDVYEWTSGALVNGGETIELQNGAGATIDIVTYSDTGDWPTEPDGYGPSLELINPSLDNSVAANWQASYVDNGTPGAENSAADTNVYSQVKIMLEGVYDVANHNMLLNLNANLPLTSPYMDILVVTAIPATAVDWVYIELRDAPDSPCNGSSFFVTQDGYVVTENGNAVNFDNPAGDYYVVVIHRNHIAAMSLVAHTFDTSMTQICDLTLDNSANFGTIANDGVNELETGVYGLIAGETTDPGSTGGTITDPDKGIINTDNGASGYQLADINFSATVTDTDKGFINLNNGKTCQVPAIPVREVPRSLSPPRSIR